MDRLRRPDLIPTKLILEKATLTRGKSRWAVRIR